MSTARRRNFAVVIGALAFAAAGCAGILGDFESTPAGAGDDGGGGDKDANSSADGTSPVDGSVGDDGSTQDSPVTDGSDAGDAADGNIPTLTCLEQGGGNNRTKIATLPKAGSSDKSGVRLFMVGTSGNTHFRAVVEEQPQNGPSIEHVYTFGNGVNLTDTPVPGNGNGGNGMIALGRYPTGLAALVNTSILIGGAQKSVTEIVTLEDSASAWTVAYTLPDSTLPPCTNRLSGAIHTVAAATNDFFIELAYQSCGDGGGGNPPPGTPYNHVIAHTLTGNVATWPVPPQAQQTDAGPVDSGLTGFDLAGMAVSGTSLFALTDPSGNSGPNPGIGSGLFSGLTSLGTQPTVRQLPLQNLSDLMQVLAVGSLPNGVGLSILEADLTQQSVTPTIYTGTVAASKMSTLDPATDLHATTLASISNLPINGASYHWESFGSPFPSDNLIGVGSVFPGSNGLNFIWWNGQGGVRSKRTGAASFLFFDPAANPNGLPVYGGDLAFNGAPFGAIAGFEMVFVQADLEASTVVDVWATQVACSP